MKKEEIKILKEYLKEQKQNPVFIFDDDFKRINNKSMMDFLFDLLKQSKEIKKEELCKYLKKMRNEFNIMYFNIDYHVLKIKSNGELLEV